MSEEEGRDRHTRWRLVLGGEDAEGLSPADLERD
jgi:hypothetical protein